MGVPQQKLKLVLRVNGQVVKDFPLLEGTNLVGRWDSESGAFPEIDLEEADVDAKISRKHAIVRLDSAGVFVEDVGSLNGTFLNRTTKLDAGDPHPLNLGDEIMVGNLFLRLEVETYSGDQK